MSLEDRIEELIDYWINGDCNFVIEQIAGFSREKAMYIIAYMCIQERFRTETSKMLLLLGNKIDETTMW